MRADFYSYNKDTIANAPAGSEKREMGDYMILDGTSIADTFQGAVFKSILVPTTIRVGANKYNHKYCDNTCVARLKSGCRFMGTLRNVQNWCLTALDWLGNIADLEGPTSYVLAIVAHIMHNESAANRGEMEAVLVASAATSAMLTSNWWRNGQLRFCRSAFTLVGYLCWSHQVHHTPNVEK